MNRFERLRGAAFEMMRNVPPLEGAVLSSFSLEVPRNNVAPLVAAMIDFRLLRITVEPHEIAEPDGLEYFLVSGKLDEADE